MSLKGSIPEVATLERHVRFTPGADIVRPFGQVRKVPQTEVKRQAITSTTLNDIVQSLLNEVSDYRHGGAFRCFGDLPAIRKPFELNEIRRQRRNDVAAKG
jgi:hypothetical protein